jgi:predicted metal-dependent phosphoesterase TrpH
MATTKTETGKPRVGDGATYTLWTDSHACTVIAVSASGKRVTLQRDKATIINVADVRAGKAEPEYVYERDTEGATYVVSLRGNGRWKTVGQDAKSPGGVASFGRRHEYYDPHF